MKKEAEQSYQRCRQKNFTILPPPLLAMETHHLYYFWHHYRRDGTLWCIMPLCAESSMGLGCKMVKWRKPH